MDVRQSWRVGAGPGPASAASLQGGQIPGNFSTATSRRFLYPCQGLSYETSAQFSFFSLSPPLLFYLQTLIQLVVNLASTCGRRMWKPPNPQKHLQGTYLSRARPNLRVSMRDGESLDSSQRIFSRRLGSCANAEKSLQNFDAATLMVALMNDGWTVNKWQIGILTLHGNKKGASDTGRKI